jgi:hypothetical protein
MWALFRTVKPLINLPPSWNLGPTYNPLAVRRGPETGELHLAVLRCGLVPDFTNHLTSARKADQCATGERRDVGHVPGNPDGAA